MYTILCQELHEGCVEGVDGPILVLQTHFLVQKCYDRFFYTQTVQLFEIILHSLIM